MTRRDALTAAAALTLARPLPADASDAATLKLLDDFAAAWNRHDVDGLMACMAPDCVFEAAAPLVLSMSSGGTRTGISWTSRSR